MNDFEKMLLHVGTMLVQKPDNKLRQIIWSETYLAGLKEGNGIVVSSCDADATLAKFDLLFTQKTPV